MIMSIHSSGSDIDGLAVRLAEDLRVRFVELTCPVCHAPSGRIALGNRAAQKGFDELHRHCYVRPFADAGI
jgi:hypothetical protein